MKRRIWSVILVLSMVLSLVPVFSLQAFAENGSPKGNGTPADPYLIEDADDLAWFRDKVNGGDTTKCASLTNDIDLSSKVPWTPIGANYVQYSGIFDGRNHKVYGMEINYAGNWVGFIGTLAGSGCVKNLHVKGKVKTTGSSAGCTGGLIGILHGNGLKVSNCSFEGDVDGAGYWVGGLIGLVLPDVNATVTIENSWVAGGTVSNSTTSASRKVGGLVGAFGGGNKRAGYSNINNCFSSMDGVASEDNDAALSGGSILGQTATFNNCYSDGKNYKFAFNFINYNDSPTIDYGYSSFLKCHAYGSYSGVYNTYSLASTFNANGSFVLSPTSTAGTTAVTSITTSDFENQTTFDATPSPGWDFTDTDGNAAVWIMNKARTYPILKPSIIPSDADRDLVYYGGTDNDNTFDLTKFVTLMLDTGYDNLSNRFTFSLDSGNTTETKHRWDNTAYTWQNGTSVTLASVSGNTLTLAPDMPIGDYTGLKIKVVDNDGLCDDAYITLNIKKKQHIPAPALDPTPSPMPTYNPGVAAPPVLTLDNLKLNEGWQWEDRSIIPKNSDSNPDPYYIFTSKQGYNAFYAFQTPVNDSILNAANYYDWDDVTNYAAANSLTVNPVTSPSYGITVVYDPGVKNSDESPYVKYIRVVDADTGQPITGATVTCTDKDGSGNPHYPDEFPMNTTDTTQDTTKPGTRNDGQPDTFAYAELSPGSHTLKATMTGYDDNSVTTVITKDSLTGEYDVIEILLSPRRGSFTLPPVYIKTKDSAGNVNKSTDPVPNAYITLTKVDTTDAPSWNNGEASMRVKVGSGAFPIPYDVPFELRSSTNGYSKDEIIYMMATAAGGVKYYKDPACNAADEITTAADQALWAFELGDPTYTATIAAGTNTGEYTVTITLENIKATYGAFGLKYDNTVFKPINPNPSGGKNSIAGGSSITLGSDIASLTTVETMYLDTWANKNGYYVFEWHADDGSAYELDTETGSKVIATFNFELINVADADAASYDWFDIMKWGDTQAAINMVAGLPTGADDMIWEHWRVVDGDNAPGAPAYARLESPKAVVNGTDTKGFFQAAVNEDLTDPTAFTFYDVKTILDWKITVNNSILQFHMFDRANTTIDLDNAQVNLYDDPSGAYVKQKLSDTAGIAKFAVNTTSGAFGPNFTYTVSRPGYWPIPVDGLAASRPGVYAPTGVVTKIPVPMDKKIYHVPVVTNTGITGVGNHDLGGEKFAYNGRDFHFRAKAAKGYKIVTYPTAAKVSIWDEATKSLQVLYPSLPVNATDGYFTIPAADLKQSTLADLHTNDLAQYNYLMSTETATYGASIYNDVTTGAAFDPTTQPDAEGFRSCNIYIEFENFTVKEIPYQVEGVTNDSNMGTVIYTPASGELPEETTAPAGSSNYRLVKTLTSENSGGPNRKTGTFEFHAVSGYKIEKVYINGLRSYGYDGETDFTYTFGEVDMDCNITVIFWDGVNHSQDKLMTLVVGEYGYVNTTSANHQENDEISNTRRVYLNKGELKFDQDTYFPGVYELNKVEKEIETAGTVTRSTLTNTTSYTIQEVAGENVIVYVTFKHKDANPATTPNRFVKSYVMQGRGVVAPAGVLIYCLYDTVNLQLDADQSVSTRPFTVKGVELQDYDTLAQTGTYDYAPAQPQSATYTYPSLTDNIAIGAVFVEPTYTITGNVNLAQGPPGINSNAVQSGAMVTFYRLDGSGNEITPQIPYTFTTTKSRTAAVFTASIPADHWNVYVTKPGYLTYKITDFDMTSTTTQFGNGNIITPYIGSTGNGKSITLTDAANVKSGWRKGVNSVVYARADVDDDGSVSIEDLTYIWHNYNQRIVEQPYNDFKQFGSSAITKISP